MQIIGGWEQYFDDNREIESIFEYVALFTASQTCDEYRAVLYDKRLSLNNIYKDIAIYLGNLWKNYGRPEAELFEYEQFFHIEGKTYSNYSENHLKEILSFYRKMMVIDDGDLMTELMQAYTDVREYEKASYWMEQKEKLEKRYSERIVPVVEASNEGVSSGIVFDGSTYAKMLKVFVGREDVYCLDTISYDSKRQIEPQLMPLTEEVIKEHLSSKKCIGTYLQRPNSTVKFIVIDIDISKKIMLQYERNSEQFLAYLSKAQVLSAEIIKIVVPHIK